MFTFFFTPDPVVDWESAKRCDTARFKQFFHWMLDRGIYLAPSQFEAGFVSTVHSQQDISRTVDPPNEFFISALCPPASSFISIVNIFTQSRSTPPSLA